MADAVPVADKTGAGSKVARYLAKQSTFERRLTKYRPRPSNMTSAAASSDAHRDHVLPPEGLETCRDALRSMPECLLLCRRPRRNRRLLALINESQP